MEQHLGERTPQDSRESERRVTKPSASFGALKWIGVAHHPETTLGRVLGAFCDKKRWQGRIPIGTLSAFRAPCSLTTAILFGHGCDAQPHRSCVKPGLQPPPPPTPPASTMKRNETNHTDHLRTVEKDCVRPIRFRTDAVTSSNSGVPAQFHTTETRKLPGAPKAAERLRQQVQ